MEEEVRRILQAAVEKESRTEAGLGSRIAACFAAVGLAEDLPELPGQIARPADFGS